MISAFAPSSLELSPAILHSSAVGTKLLMRERERVREREREEGHRFIIKLSDKERKRVCIC